MSEIARLYKYKGLLARGRVMSASALQAELEISSATLKRDLAKLRDQLHVPIVFDRDRGGYRMEQDAEKAELPGLWFSHDELLALLTIQQLLSKLEPTVLASTLRPIQGRFNELMRLHGLEAQDVTQRLVLLNTRKRMLPPKAFETVASATMNRKRLRITHLNRQTSTTLEREVSPQRLVYYDDNWYLDAWCHLREGLRCFSVDAIAGSTVLDHEAKEVAFAVIEAQMGAGYGIFSGAHTTWVTLKFSPKRAQWVSREIWHPDQRSTTEADGSFILSVPFSDDRELVGDILWFGPDVEVLSPPELKAKVQRQLLAAIAGYV
jgi:predicted DNA-binding transcriptional regulator YafY